MPEPAKTSRSKECKVDLRDADRLAFHDLWGKAVPGRLSTILKGWLDGHERDAHNPLLPDLLGAYPMISAALHESGAVLPERLGPEMMRLAAATISVLAARCSVEVAGLGQEFLFVPSGKPRPVFLKAPPSVCGLARRPWQDLAREGRAGEAILAEHEPSSAEDLVLLASALLSLHATLEARALARTARSRDEEAAPKALRIEILASRAVGRAERPTTSMARAHNAACRFACGRVAYV